MKKAIFYFLLIWPLMTGYQLFAEKTKQALRALEKGDYEKVEEILTKSMRKDSLNPATEYVWALLYTVEDYPGYHLDTAHMYIQFACEHFKLQNEDHLDELDDANLYEYDLKNKKIAIDSIAFARAVETNTEEGYQHFINNYFDAADYPKAVSIRNQLVFEQAEAIHTWQAYRDFMNKYPFATQLPKAQIQYDRLIYEEKTKSGKVADLIKFLEEEPDTPYRHSIEKKIFEDYIGQLDSAKIMTFCADYDNPVLLNRAYNVLYHLEGFDFATYVEKQNVSQQYLDSVNHLKALNNIPLIVRLNDSKFQFMELNGNVFFHHSFEAVKGDYRCGNIIDDLLEVVDQGVNKLINRKGDEIFEGHTGSVIDLGNGLLSIEESGKRGLVHKSGFRLLASEYDDLQLLEGRLIVFSIDGKFGIMSITGKIYVNPIYDNITLRGQFWVFEKDETVGVSNIESILQRENIASLELPYEEVELINNRYIIGFLADEEVLLNSNLERLSPPATQRINTRHETWVLELENGYTTFDPDLGKLSSNTYQNVLQNTEWLGLTRNRKWFVYNKSIYDEPIIGIDSLKLLGEDMAILFRGTAGMAIFPNKMVVDIIQNQFLKSIGPKVQSDAHYLVIKKYGENILYKDGIEQFRVACDELGYISDSAFSIKKNDKYGAVDLSGRLIMRVRYDAISQAEDGVAPVLYRGKFGAYNFKDKILLRIDYQEKMKRYNANLFIVNKDGKYGLLNRFNEQAIEANYDKIAYWTDSTFLGLQDGMWGLVDINTQEVAFSSIEYYEIIKTTPGEKVLLVRKEKGYGIYHETEGLLIPTVFHDVINLGNKQDQVYFAETSISEADIYVVVYYDSKGNKLFSEAYRSEVYEELVCED